MTTLNAPKTILPQPANVTLRKGDVLKTAQPAFGHGVNVMGVMGSGIARTIRRAYPAVFPPYSVACSSKLLAPGSMLPILMPDDRWIFNLASQDLPGAHARLTWLEDSVEASFLYCEEEGLSGFALPRIGAGIGGLEWEDAYEVLKAVAAGHPTIELELWEFSR